MSVDVELPVEPRAFSYRPFFCSVAPVKANVADSTSENVALRVTVSVAAGAVNVSVNEPDPEDESFVADNVDVPEPVTLDSAVFDTDENTRDDATVSVAALLVTLAAPPVADTTTRYW